MIRVFVGIPVSEEFQLRVFSWEEKFGALPVKWARGKNLHITLVPPWYAEGADCAVGELSDIKTSVKPFTLRFDRVVYGPRPEEPRLIWAETKIIPEDIFNLKSSAETVFGQRPEKRPYKPHLTLARFKTEEFASFQVKKLEEAVDWEMEVNSVVLYESKLYHSGAEYEILKEIKLGNG